MLRLAPSHHLPKGSGPLRPKAFRLLLRSLVGLRSLSSLSARSGHADPGGAARAAGAEGAGGDRSLTQGSIPRKRRGWAQQMHPLVVTFFEREVRVEHRWLAGLAGCSLGGGEFIFL